MTFDDGPCAKDFAGNGRGLTESLLDTLKEYGAHGTFDIVGSTESNYPDEAGPVGSATFGGTRFDHYPCFGEDALAGARNQPELVKRIIDEGHELTNHTDTHRLFGTKKFLYGKRQPLSSLDEVVADIKGLHRYIQENFGYTMRLSRPPHFVDNISGGVDAYDAYRIMGYQYLAASFDADGWQAQDSYESEIRHAVEPMEKLLAEDPDALNGKVIFQKDGCNMNKRSPIVDALPVQLKMLSDLGYRVITVSELLDMSPFIDLKPESRAMPYVKQLIEEGHMVGYKNNTFHPERPLSLNELWLMLASAEDIRAQRVYNEKELIKKTSKKYPVTSASGNDLLGLAHRYKVPVTDEKAFRDRKSVKREDAVELIAGIVLANR